MEFRNEAHKLAVKQAFIRITSDASWNTIRDLADEVVYEIEQKCIQEDDREKAETYRCDARGARKFWAGLLRMMELAKEADGENFNEVVM